MVYEENADGKVKISLYMPTIPAMRYLNCCTMAGWHHCNERYSKQFKDGVSACFLIFTVNGVGQITAGKKSHTLLKDSLIVIPPNTPIKYFTDPQSGFWEFYWLDLIGENLCSTVLRLWQDNHYFIRKIPTVQSLFLNLLDDSLSEFHRSKLLQQIVENVLAKNIFFTNFESCPFERIIQYISEHYQSSISLSKLSQIFFLSPNQIIRIFREKTGYTFHEYLVRFRLTKACELLQSSTESISAIGRVVGYDNNSQFSAIFRKIYGITPNEYRKLIMR